MKASPYNCGNIYVTNIITNEITRFNYMHQAAVMVEVSRTSVRCALIRKSLVKKQYLITCDNKIPNKWLIDLNKKEAINKIRQKKKYKECLELRLKRNQKKREYRKKQRELYPEIIRKKELDYANMRYRTNENHRIRSNSYSLLRHYGISAKEHPEIKQAMINLKKLQLQCQN